MLTVVNTPFDTVKADLVSKLALFHLNLAHVACVTGGRNRRAQFMFQIARESASRHHR